MYHLIEMVVDLRVDLIGAPRHRRKRRSFRKGSQLWVQIRPYVTEDEDGPAEVADLVFEDGSTVPQVPFACFAFVDSGRAPPPG